MAVGLLNGRPDRRADMREEQMRTDVPGELAQVLVIPGRLDAAEDPGDRCGVIPADAEPVPVGRLAPSREPSSGRSANRPGAGHVCEQDRRTGIASQRHISRNFQPPAGKDPAQVGNSRRSLMTWRRRAGPAHPTIRTCWKPAYRAPNRREPAENPLATPGDSPRLVVGSGDRWHGRANAACPARSPRYTGSLPSRPVTRMISTSSGCGATKCREDPACPAYLLIGASAPRPRASQQLRQARSSMTAPPRDSMVSRT